MRRTASLLALAAVVTACTDDARHPMTPPGRPVLSTATVADGDVAGLIAAIHAANNETVNPGLDVIELAAGGTYTLNTVDNTTHGATGLPVVTSQIVVNGHGASIVRDASAPAFRLLDVAATGKLVLDHVTLRNGKTDGGGGGAITTAGTVELRHSLVEENAAGEIGGAIQNGGVLKVTSTVIRRNAVTWGSMSGGGGINSFGIVELVNSTVSENVVDGANDMHGGGIRNSGMLTVRNSTIAGNRAGGSFADGGGIYNDRDAGRLTIDGSTISGNEAAGRSNAQGGGIYTDAGDWWTKDQQVVITNSTIAGNAATGPWYGIGGGIRSSVATVRLTISGSTIANNVASTMGGNLLGNAGGRSADIFVSSSIIAGGRLTGGAPSNCAFESGTSTVSLGHNVEDANSCGLADATDQVNTDPLLDPTGLADNGGPTKTIALLAGSPARDVMTFRTDGCGTTLIADQRGYSRPLGAGCDAGAFEATVLYPFVGFFSPVDNPPAVNLMRAGQTVAVRFSLGADRGLGILAPGSPTSLSTACGAAGATLDAVEETLAASGGGLSYNAGAGYYEYAWKTSRSWAGTCREFILRLGDGTEHRATFRFQ